jgi:hypothetical protein
MTDADYYNINSLYQCHNLISMSFHNVLYMLSWSCILMS